MNLIVVLGPGAAPIIGGAITAYIGWRSIFYFLCAFGFANLILTWFVLKETLIAAEDQSIRAIMRSYGHLVRTPAFVAYAIGGGCATTSLYGFISAAPFIFINDLHRPTQEVGIYLGLVLLGGWIGSLVASRLIRSGALDRLMIRGNLISIAAAIFLLGVVATGHLSVWLVVVPMMVFMFGAVIASPAAMTRAIGINPHIAGSASGVYGFTQMGVGAICTALVGIGGDPALTATIVLVTASIIGQISFWFAIRASRQTSVATSHASLNS